MRLYHRSLQVHNKIYLKVHNIYYRHIVDSRALFSNFILGLNIFFGRAAGAESGHSSDRQAHWLILRCAKGKPSAE